MAVAAEYTDLISAAQMKNELRVPSGVTSKDSIIANQIKAAGSFIANKLSLPLIAETVKWTVPEFPGEDEPIELPFRYVTSVEGIKYWTPDASLRADPDGSIAKADLGRVAPFDGSTHSGYKVYWPTDGWPDAEPPPAFVEITFKRGMDPVPEGIKQAIILAARDFFEGQRMVDTTKSAIEALLMPWNTHRPEAIAQHERYHGGD